VYLVFPFENTGGGPRLAWLGEGLEELTVQRLAAAGEQAYQHSDRVREMELSGLPSTPKLSRATMLHLAEDLDADFVVFGNYRSDGTSFAVSARVLRVNPPALLPTLNESGELKSLMDVHTRLVWRMLGKSEQAFPLTLAEFSKLQPALRLDAFEHYVRGLLASEDETKVRELREAARLQPDWMEADFALGEAYLGRRDCSSAVVWYGRVAKTHKRYPEATFGTGVCRLILDQPERAEEAFLMLQEALHAAHMSGADSPEILNDLAVARLRLGKTSAAQSDLRKATDLDPDEDDYPFNAGLAAVKAGDFAAAAGFFRDASEREPDNPEDRSMLIAVLEKAGKKEEADQAREAASEAFGPNGLPKVRLDPKSGAAEKIERIKMELDTTALRLESDTLQTAGDASGPGSADTPGAHVRRGRQELSAGRLDTAEKEFRAALAASPTNPAAHSGLGEVERRQGKLDDAVKELQASLEVRDSAVVRTTLARVYLEQKKPDLARGEVERALKIAPNYAEAKQLLDHLRNSKAGESKPQGGAR
jgi:tetratricopeptide (TPR) repeat protein